MEQETPLIQVLHVDDDPQLLKLSSSLLERSSEQITVATETNAETALERVQTDTVDCVVSDYDMPSMDGLQFLDEVRAHNPDIPFILFTGKGSEEIASQAISAGVTDYLQKGSGTEQYEVLANRIENVVDRLRAERRLQRHESNLRFLEQVVEQIDVGVCAYTADGTVTYANDALATLLGTDRDTIQNRPLWSIASEFDENEFDIYWDSFNLGDTDRTEMFYERPDGGMVPVELHTTCIEINETRYHVTTVTDITEQSTAEADIWAEKQLFETLLETNPSGVVMIDWDGDIVFANEQAEDILELKEQDAVDSSQYTAPDWCVRETYGPADATTTLPFRTVMETGEVIHNDRYGIEFPDGTTKYVSLNGAPIYNENDDIDRAVFSVTDITTQVANERELERQNRRLKQFATVLSHDLRNPLNIAEGHRELLAEEVSDSDAAEYVTEIEDAHTRMQTLIDDVLSLARHGEYVTDPNPVAIETVAQSAWDALTTETASLTIETDIVVLADESRIRQVFENLFRNAIEHVDDDVTVRVGKIDERDGIYVEDDGPGIPPGKREKVFEPSYSTASDGTGFGLAIVAGITDAHEWEINITDGRDNGARVEITNIDWANEPPISTDT